MKKNKLKVLGTTSLAAMILLSSGTSMVSANGSPDSSVKPPVSQEFEQRSLTKEEKVELKSFFDQYNVEKNVQNKLIKKLNDGELWDSLKGNQEIVKVKEVETETGFEKIETYEDGSIIVSTVDSKELVEVSVEEKDEFGTYAVSPGTVTSGSGYKTFRGAKVYVKSGIANCHFFANFTILNSGMDYISSAYDHSITTIGGTYSDDKLSITRSKETLDYRAEAKLSFKFEAYSGAGAQTVWIKLNVGRNAYYESHN